MADSQRSPNIRASYDAIAGTYDRRYEINPQPGIAQALRGLLAETGARRVLEVGCGTGHWLKILANGVERIVGLDLSTGMLSRVDTSAGPIELVCASADSLPFAGSTFDFVFVVNALHFFGDKRRFISQARRLLRPGGAFAIVGMDVPAVIGNWVIYEYFPGALEYDRSRFPALDQVVSWMQEEGLTVQQPHAVEFINAQICGRAILDDHFIHRHGTSTLMGLSDEQYRAGIDRIRSAIAEAEAQGKEAVFRTDFQLKMIVGRAQG